MVLHLPSLFCSYSLHSSAPCNPCPSCIPVYNLVITPLPLLYFCLLLFILSIPVIPFYPIWALFYPFNPSTSCISSIPCIACNPFHSSHPCYNMPLNSYIQTESSYIQTESKKEEGDKSWDDSPVLWHSGKADDCNLWPSLGHQLPNCSTVHSPMAPQTHEDATGQPIEK